MWRVRLGILDLSSMGATWHDVNKRGDDAMCWAAAAANILAWTGWGYEYDESDLTTGLWGTDSDGGMEELVLLPVTYDSENFQWYLTDALYWTSQRPEG